MSFISFKTKKKFKSQSQEKVLSSKRLEDYKQKFKNLAEEKGVCLKFMNAKTLTQAKKILWGGGS